MASYSLSDEALEDLDRLYEYGILNFGLSKADNYYDELIERFAEMTQNPFLYPAVDHIRMGYRLSVFGAHGIYYQTTDNKDIFIVRILGRQSRENI